MYTNYLIGCVAFLRRPIGWYLLWIVDDDVTLEVVKAKLTEAYGRRLERDVYAPVTSHVSLRAFIVAASKKNLHVHHFDVKADYLHGSHDEETFMKQPPEYYKDAA